MESKHSCKKEFITLNSKQYPLNKSNSKHVSIALACEFGFQPCIVLGGFKSDRVIFSEYEWKDFLNFQGVLSNYFYTQQVPEAINAAAFSISFEKFKEVKVLKIQDNRSGCIYLAEESFCTLLMLLPLIEYRVDILKKNKFETYFKDQLKSVKANSGDVCQQLLNYIYPLPNLGCENISTLMEVLFLHPQLCILPNSTPNYSLNFYNVLQ